MSDADPRRRRFPGGELVGRIVPPVVGVVGFLALWQLAVAVFSIKRFELPPPSDVLRELAHHPGYYATNGRTTLWEALLGFALALGAALVVGTVMAHVRVVEQALVPLVVLIQVTPLIAYAPAVSLWLNGGLRTIVVLTATVCSVPFVVGTVAGLRAADPDALDLLHSVDASRWETFVRLRLPSALPSLFTAAKVAVGLALVGAVLGEFFALTDRGLGVVIKRSQNNFTYNVDRVWGAIFTLSICGSVAVLLVGLAERTLLSWHASQQR